MRIIKWLAPNNSNVNGAALIRVEPDEIADIEQMLILVDGDSVGHFGVSVSLVSEDTEPEIEPQYYRGKPIGRGYYEAKGQFGFHNASSLKKKVRYYKCFVHRD